MPRGNSPKGKICSAPSGRTTRLFRDRRFPVGSSPKGIYKLAQGQRAKRAPPWVPMPPPISLPRRGYIHSELGRQLDGTVLPPASAPPVVGLRGLRLMGL